MQLAEELSFTASHHMLFAPVTHAQAALQQHLVPHFWARLADATAAGKAKSDVNASTTQLSAALQVCCLTAPGTSLQQSACALPTVEAK